MTSQTRYGLYVLLSAVMAAVAWILTEVAISFYKVGPLLVVLLGNLIGGGLLLAASIRNFAGFRATWQRRNWTTVILAAFLIYSLAFMLSFNAIRLIGSGKSALLGQLQTPFIVILAILFLGEQLSTRRWQAGVLAIGGALLINLEPGALRFSLGWGELLATLAPFCIAAGIILLKPLLDRSDAQWVTGLGLLTGACFLIPLVPFYDAPVGLGWAALAVITGMGIVRGGSWLVYNLALQHIGAARSAIIFISFAFFTVALQLIMATAAPALGLQLPTNLLITLIGGALVAVGVILLQTESV